MSGCSDEFERVLRKYFEMDIKKLNAKQMEIELEDKIAELIKYFEKTALGEKTEKKK